MCAVCCVLCAVCCVLCSVFCVLCAVFRFVSFITGGCVGVLVLLTLLDEVYAVLCCVQCRVLCIELCPVLRAM